MEQLFWTSEDILLAGTSRGALLQIHWPPRNDDADILDDLSTSDSAHFSTSLPITARVLRLHQGWGEPCFSLLSRSLTLGRGFVHPLRRCLADSLTDDCNDSGNAYFLVSLFPCN